MAWLNIATDTPFPDLIPKSASSAGTNIANAVNWALKYQNESDPAERTPTGGPDGCFRPYLPELGPLEQWLLTSPLFMSLQIKVCGYLVAASVRSSLCGS